MRCAVEVTGNGGCAQRRSGYQAVEVFVVIWQIHAGAGIANAAVHLNVLDIRTLEPELLGRKEGAGRRIAGILQKAVAGRVRCRRIGCAVQDRAPRAARRPLYCRSLGLPVLHSRVASSGRLIASSYSLYSG